MKKVLLISTIIFALMACNNGEVKQPENETENNKTQSDVLFDEVMAGHDVAMAKMNKISRLQRETKAALDSITKLPPVAKKSLSGVNTKLTSSLKSLEYAETAMNKWMQEFKYDSLQHNEPERIKYLHNENEKVNKVKSAVLNSIATADSVLATIR